MGTNFNFDFNLDYVIKLLPIVIPLMVLQMALMLSAAISICRKPGSFRGEKLVWLIVILIVNTIGPILYFSIGAKRLEEGHDNEYD